MTTMRILFCSHDSPGHLFPLVGLALALRRRGHTVAFATSDKMQPMLDAAEIERIPRADTDGSSFRLGRWGWPIPTAVDVKHTEYAAKRFGPDLLVSHQLCQAPLLVRERQGLSLVVMGLFPYLWPVAGPASPPLYEALHATRAWRLQDMVRVLNEARALFRLPPVEAGDPMAHPLLGDRFLLRSVPALEPELDALPPAVRLVGPCLWEPEQDSAAAWGALRDELPAGDAPLVYVQHGRSFDLPGFWTQLVEALGGEAVRVVASVGRMDRKTGPLPDNFLVRDHVSQGLVLPHAQAAVSSGNTSVVLGALAHGLPSVVLPGGGETADNATKLELLGYGVRMEQEGLEADRLREAVFGVLEPGGVALRTREAQRATDAWMTFAAAADEVEAVGAGARSPQPAESLTLA